MAIVVMVGAMWLMNADDAEAGDVAEGIDVVYVAVSTNFPDALGVGPGAGVNAGPIILVPTDPPIPPLTEVELLRLDPKKVVIVGGEGVVSAAMGTALQSLLPLAAIERLSGSDRYETNTLFTQSIYPVESWTSVHTTGFTPIAGATIVHQETYAHGSDGDIVAPIPLPHGARILELRVRGLDDDAAGGEDVDVSLKRQCNTTLATILSVVSSGAPGTFDLSDVDSAGSYREDDEDCVSFVLIQDSDADNYVRSVHVRYQLGSPGG
ncbi:MAG TPA: cell wall-binding repeat-containing protein [Acidimicrobiia bacterium]|nr:cell wall-binding repeat-containing protein [Acidimicrobiia bacterium]